MNKSMLREIFEKHKNNKSPKFACSLGHKTEKQLSILGDIMNKQQLKIILDNHKKWLEDKGGQCANLKNANLEMADLKNANLSSANLSSANLRSADLKSADLKGVNLKNADLRGANLTYANLSSANLRGVNLTYADLRDANLRSADLRYTDLRNANLRNANLRNADLRSANLDFSCLPLWCGGLNWKVDKNIFTQIMYHLDTFDCKDKDIQKLKKLKTWRKLVDNAEVKQKHDLKRK